MFYVLFILSIFSLYYSMGSLSDPLLLYSSLISYLLIIPSFLTSSLHFLYFFQLSQLNLFFLILKVYFSFLFFLVPSSLFCLFFFSLLSFNSLTLYLYLILKVLGLFSLYLMIFISSKEQSLLILFLIPLSMPLFMIDDLWLLLNIVISYLFLAPLLTYYRLYTRYV